MKELHLMEMVYIKKYNIRGIIIDIDEKKKKPYLVKFILPFIDYKNGGVRPGKRFKKKHLKSLEYNKFKNTV